MRSRSPRLSVLLCATFLLSTFAHTFASEQTALDRYVAAPDPSYAYRVVGTQDSLLSKTFVLEMTSQTWLTKAEVDQPVWKHWLIITVPKKVSSSTALIIISGGANDRPAPQASDKTISLGAVATQSVVAEIRGIPSEPLTFTDDGKKTHRRLHHRVHLGQVPPHPRREVAPAPSDDQGRRPCDGHGSVVP